MMMMMMMNILWEHVQMRTDLKHSLEREPGKIEDDLFVSFCWIRNRIIFS